MFVLVFGLDSSLVLSLSTTLATHTGKKLLSPYLITPFSFKMIYVLNFLHVIYFLSVKLKSGIKLVVKLKISFNKT